MHEDARLEALLDAMGKRVALGRAACGTEICW
jgi:hypothetical protein